MQRMAATPAARLALSKMNQLIDVRAILSSINVPLANGYHWVPSGEYSPSDRRGGTEI
jgi:hypothetical protein